MTEAIYNQLTAVSAAERKTGTQVRAEVRGKFLYAGDEKLYVRGVTYGPFHPDEDGCLYHDTETAEKDFASMALNGINAIRTYTVPPKWLLDAAYRTGIWVMVGLPWEQHIAFLENSQTELGIEHRVREAVRSCDRHPAILCYTIGNEIPSSIVRWHGRKSIQKFLGRLYNAVKREDPAALVTYVNFPPTEYLQLDFLDFISFNVYLEKQDRLEAYLARLQNLAGKKPLVMAEVGLDSRRNGELQQALVLDWQVRTVFSAGCAGVFVFAWTDEWSRGGFEIEDWDFGVTTRSRSPKPALRVIASAFAKVPFLRDQDWPWVSVVVCSYNGGRTIRQTLEEVFKLDYPSYEVIVVNDGSRDNTPEIVAGFPQVRLITVPNGGLSEARNIGMRAAQGEIIAYIDDDAYPDRHWLQYLAMTFRRTAHVAIGGPNIPPPGDGLIAECVGNAPGGPTHVLLTDELAEHIPGCNFAVRRKALEEIGGFDPLYRVAGDDVDTCWRLQEAGGTLGFAPAAVVWHHRRNSVKAYWRQQLGYGKAEGLLERKWPQKYNASGHLTWFGRVYGAGVLRAVGNQWRVYQGTWGTALFQSIYEPYPGLIQSYAQMPEWYLLAIMLLVVGLLGFSWFPLFALGSLAASFAFGVPIAQAVAAARRAEFPSRPTSGSGRLRLVLLTTVLFVIQPIARLRGRLGHGLTPFRRRSGTRVAPVRIHNEMVWTERWQMPETWLASLESIILRSTSVQRGGDFDEWDLQIRGGVSGETRVQLAVEEHGAGRQLLRFRVMPRLSRVLMVCSLVLLFLSACAGARGGTAACALLFVLGTALIAWTWRDAGVATGAALTSVNLLRESGNDRT